MKDKDYAVIDVETTELKAGEIPKTLFWGYADSTGYRRFDSTGELLLFLRQIPKKTLLHHANYDIIQLLVDGAKLQIQRSHNGKLIRCKLGKHSTLNTYATYPVSLAEIFESMGFKKSPLENLQQRNYEDCVNGLTCFLALDSTFFDLCGVSPLSRGTIAGTSFHAAEVFAGQMPEDQRFLHAYRGGRTEVFDLRFYAQDKKDYDYLLQYIAEQNAKDFDRFSLFERIPSDAAKFDINSSYPFSILDSPIKAELFRIEVKTKDYYCPFFQAARDDLLLFPNGRFVSYVFKDVFQRYIEPYLERTSIRILSRHKFDFLWLDKIKPLIQRVYDTKQKANEALRLVCKFFLNSCYGRIGLRGETERARIIDYRPDKDNASCFRIGRKTWLVFDIIQRPVRSNFPFAAYITDNGRARLYQGFKNQPPLYGDTDAIVSRQHSFFGKLGNGCGEWKNEGTEPFLAINVKDYLWGHKEIRKGGRKFLKWTLKQYGAGKNVEEISRSRLSDLRKRIVLPNGETVPITI